LTILNIKIYVISLYTLPLCMIMRPTIQSGQTVAAETCTGRHEVGNCVL